MQVAGQITAMQCTQDLHALPLASSSTVMLPAAVVAAEPLY